VYVFTASKYPLLRFVTVCLHIIGWMLILLGAVGMLLIFLILTEAHLQQIPLLSALSLPVLGPLTLSVLLLGLLCIACGELIRVFVEIALNTRVLLEIVREFTKS
jgi:hypothetical protein